MNTVLGWLSTALFSQPRTMTLYTMDSNGIQDKKTLLVQDFVAPSSAIFLQTDCGPYTVWYQGTNYNRRNCVTVAGICFCGPIQVAKRDESNDFFIEFDTIEIEG